MKNYEQPAFELIKFSAVDVIMTSEAFTPGSVETGGNPMQGL